MGNRKDGRHRSLHDIQLKILEIRHSEAQTEKHLPKVIFFWQASGGARALAGAILPHFCGYYHKNQRGVLIPLSTVGNKITRPSGRDVLLFGGGGEIRTPAPGLPRLTI